MLAWLAVFGVSAYRALPASTRVYRLAGVPTMTACCPARIVISIMSSYDRLSELTSVLEFIMETGYPLPSPVIRSLAKLGGDLSLARRRRRLTQRSLAERSGIGLSTVRRLERGDPKVALEYLGRVLFVLGEGERLETLLSTEKDAIGLIMMNERLPARVRARKTSWAL